MSWSLGDSSLASGLYEVRRSNVSINQLRSRTTVSLFHFDTLAQGDEENGTR